MCAQRIATAKRVLGLAMAANRPIHTVPTDEGWQNRREGASRGGPIFATKLKAQNAGKAQAMRDKTEHIIHNKNGEIGVRHSYGNDPHPPQG